MDNSFDTWNVYTSPMDIVRLNQPLEEIKFSNPNPFFDIVHNIMMFLE